MKIARFLAVIFAVLGIVLMLGSGVVCFASLGSSVKILEYPQGAAACSESLREAVCAGDYAALEQLLYGNARLGGTDSADDPAAALIWEAFRSNMTLEYTGSLYLLDSQLSQDGKLTVVDVPKLLESMEQKVQELLNQKVLAAQDSARVRAADGTYAAETVEEAIREAVSLVLQEELPHTTKHITVQLIHRDGRWWAVPDQAFFSAISGPAA